MFRTCIYSVVLFLCCSLSAQEFLRPLNSHISISETGEVISREQHRSSAITLQLPFFDDFSYSTSQIYPAQGKWTDQSVFINSGLGRNPPSIGVATFDGLNKHGYPYVPGLTDLNRSEPADTLTSQAIDLHILASSSKTLQPSDSLALTFFYQPRGWGESPDASDSLIVDFYKPRQNRWESRVWFMRGNKNSNVSDTAFKYVMVRINDTAYFDPGFRFRFRNRATTAGNFDHWNLDYVYLNQGIFNVKPVYDDITFAYVPSTFLKEYAAMPYQQYQIQDMAEKLSVKIRNSSPNVATMSYLYDVYNDASKQNIFSYDGGPVNLAPYTTSGYSKHGAHATPPVNSQFTFPEMTDSTDFLIKHYVKRSGTIADDFSYENDTVLQYQRFRNYYAYDDGTAEAAYYVQGSGGRIAVKLKLNVPDTLFAVRIYFDPAGNVLAAQNYLFDIKVWAEGPDGYPGALIRSDADNKVKYFNTGFKGVPEYDLSSRLALAPGTYFVGLQQKVLTGIAVGYDLNSNFSRNTYYDEGKGWKQSTLGGGIMLRPVFGKYIPPPPMGAGELSSENFLTYPNPAADLFYVHGENGTPFTWTLYNALGQLVAAANDLQPEHSVETGHLTNGVYFLHIKTGNRLNRQKVLIQH